MLRLPQKHLSFIYFLLGITIIFNLILVYRLHENKIQFSKLENYSNVLILKNEEYKFHIKQNLNYNISNFENSIQKIYSNDSTIFTRDSIYILLLPQEACYACISDLFIELNHLQIDPNSIYLFMETSNKQLQREWTANNFKLYKVDSKNTFQTLKLKDNIVILKIINNKLSNILFKTNIITTEFLSIFWGQKHE